jgi:hypothetical protein
LKRKSWLILSMATAAVLAAVLVVRPPASATDPSPDGVDLTSESAPCPGPVPGSAALRATVDPETGRVGVAAAPTQMTLDPETLEALRRDTEGLQQTYHADGSVSVDLQGRFQSVSVARIDGKGKLVICSENAQQIDEIMNKQTAGEPLEGQTPEVR